MNSSPSCTRISMSALPRSPKLWPRVPNWQKDTWTDLEVVQNIYDYVIKNISYDTDKASNVSYGYLPNVDETWKAVPASALTMPHL